MTGKRRPCPDCGAAAARRESVFCVECGARLPEGRRWWWAGRHARWAAAAVCAVLVVVALARVPASLTADPSAPVQELVTALEEHDTERLFDMAGFDVGDAKSFSGLRPPESSGLLGSDVLAEGYDPPDIRLGESHGTHDPATGDVGRTRGPQPRATPVTFDGDWTVRVWTDRSDTGWIRDWELREETVLPAVLGEITLPYTPVGPLVVADVRFEPTGSDRVPGSRNRADALVGTYTATYEHPLFEPVSETFVVRSGATTELALPVGGVRTSVADAVDEQIRAHVETCAAEATELRPPGCVLHHDPGHYFPLRDEARWEVESMPEVVLEAVDTAHGPDQPTATVTTVHPGTASVTYAILDEEERTVSVDIVVGGNVELDDSGRPVWRP